MRRRRRPMRLGDRAFGLGVADQQPVLRRPAGERIGERAGGARYDGTSRRPHCSAASMACARSRSTLMRLVWP